MPLIWNFARFGLVSRVQPTVVPQPSTSSLPLPQTWDNDAATPSQYHVR